MGYDAAANGRRREPRRRFSEILAMLAADEKRDRISVADLFTAMGDRTFGALMLIFAVPNLVPTPPGTSAILGAPLIFLAAQMMLGKSPWLPDVIARRSMTRSDFSAVTERAAPWIARAERMLQPRLSLLTYPPAENIIGGLCLVLAIILFLPLPLGNILPALAICLFAFGMLERDGVWVLAGGLVFVASVVVIGGVLVAGFMATMHILQQAFA
ncbi:exopolysaccharide biosynthesis protein [Rhizobium alarense]|uniref:exopolysaccharide biosynthesis protein n=1 Tax=Rhizobium alarense TaxID=2846851 RepID=UPI0038B509CA